MLMCYYRRNTDFWLELSLVTIVSALVLTSAILMTIYLMTPFLNFTATTIPIFIIIHSYIIRKSLLSKDESMIFMMLVVFQLGTLLLKIDMGLEIDWRFAVIPGHLILVYLLIE